MNWTNRDPHEHQNMISSKNKKKSTWEALGEFFGLIMWFIVIVLAIVALWYLLEKVLTS
jgi:uncharacterized membrane protein